jgi:hypothetical protein
MAIKDILVSVHGRKLGLDADGNLIINTSTGGQGILSAGGAAVSAASTTASPNIPSYGTRYLTSSPVGYTLDDPTVGVRVTILALNPTTATGRFVQTSTANGVTMGSTGGYNKWSSTAAQTLELVGLSTTNWGVVSNNLASTVSTSYGAFSTI